MLSPSQHAWISAPATQAVMAALDAARPEASRFVGGCVRNALMGRPVDDIDIATKLSPQDVIEAAQRAGLKTAPTGLEHGTITVISHGVPFEVTTLRRDVETDGRNATIAYTEDWEDDSARRDFRLNAIYADRDGRIFDPQDGVADALAGKIVFIGDARVRIREDYLRILRFYRFTAWYALEVNEDGQKACAQLAAGMRRLSAERVWKELKKLLSAPDPRRAIAAMDDAGVLGQTVPEAVSLDLLNALVTLEQGEAWPADVMLRFEALIPRLGPVIERVRSRLKLSNAEGLRLELWASQAFDPRELLGGEDLEIAKAIYPLDLQAFLDRARLAWAIDGARAEANHQEWRSLLDTVQSWERPQFPIRGSDLIAAGVEKGPRLGATLKALERLWVKGGFRAEKTALLAALSFIQASQDPVE